MKLILQPISFQEACRFVKDNHRHNKPPRGWKFGVAVGQIPTIDDIPNGWRRETSNDPSRWSIANSSYGQCAVTALVVQDLLGGELLRCKVNGISHYYNFAGKLIDLTIQQFPEPRVITERDEERTRDYVLSFPDTKRRYELLKQNLPQPKVVGVVMVGRPVSRVLDDGWTLEINRSCTDGTPNVNSMLYGAACRAAFALGYKRVITYTLNSENGASLKASNWREVGVAGGGSWYTPSRPRVDTAPTEQKKLWEMLP